MVRQARYGPALCGIVRRGMAGEARLRKAGNGLARRGHARKTDGIPFGVPSVLFYYGGMKWFSVLFTFLVVWSLGCKKVEPEQINFPVTTPSPKPVVKRIYKEPEIGMDYLDFHELCGHSSRHSSTETSQGTMITERYSKDKNNCDGDFTFVNYKLEMISR